LLNSRQRISELQKIPNVVQELVPEIPQQKNLTGTQNATKPDAF
jgi:hypothetical protein